MRQTGCLLLKLNSANWLLPVVSHFKRQIWDWCRSSNLILGSGSLKVMEASRFASPDGQDRSGWWKWRKLLATPASPPLRALGHGPEPQLLQWSCSMAADQTVVALGSFQVWMWNCVSVIRAPEKESSVSVEPPWINKGLKKKSVSSGYRTKPWFSN